MDLGSSLQTYEATDNNISANSMSGSRLGNWDISLYIEHGNKGVKTLLGNILIVTISVNMSLIQDIPVYEDSSSNRYSEVKNKRTWFIYRGLP